MLLINYFCALLSKITFEWIKIFLSAKCMRHVQFRCNFLWLTIFSFSHIHPVEMSTNRTHPETPLKLYWLSFFLSSTSGRWIEFEACKEHAHLHTIAWKNDYSFDDRNEKKKKELFRRSIIPLLHILSNTWEKRERFNIWTPSGGRPRDSIDEK